MNSIKNIGMISFIAFSILFVVMVVIRLIVMNDNTFSALLTAFVQSIEIGFLVFAGIVIYNVEKEDPMYRRKEK